MTSPYYFNPATFANTRPFFFNPNYNSGWYVNFDSNNPNLYANAIDNDKYGAYWPAYTYPYGPFEDSRYYTGTFSNRRTRVRYVR